jgi:hypothetical protein
LSAGKLLGFERPHFALETETLKTRFRTRGVVKAAFEFKLVLQIAVAFENFIEIISRFGHAMLKLVHLMFDLLQPAKRREG